MGGPWRRRGREGRRDERDGGSAWGQASVVSHKWLVSGRFRKAPGQGVRTEPDRGSFRVPRRGSLLTDLCGSARHSRLVGHENPSRRNTRHL